ncbi:menaquinone biosynthesis protein [Flavobacteriales bacterium]|nr:menaquinone biosynthesis protein [Flavobacteriales bacterium]
MEEVKEKIRVSAVSYVNSYPFIYGLRNHDVLREIDLQLDTPAECASKLINGEVDLGLVPVAIIPQLKEAHVVTNLCIGSDGPVDTVCLFSHVPLNEIETVLLDYQSRTSVQLVQLLAQKHWNISPKWMDGSKDFISEIGGTTAGVVIGDRVFEHEQKFPVVKDLSEEWKTLTGLPFVFACWVSNKPLNSDFILNFEKALSQGVENKTQSIAELHGSVNASLVRYVEESISYHLDDKKRQAMKLFHAWLSTSP